MRVLIFGDSITQGFWDLEGGWAGRLRKYHDARHIDGTNDDSPTIFNLGVSGDASDNLVQRLDNEIRVRNKYNDAIIVIAIGFNDTRTKSGKNYAEVEDYVANLGTLLKQAKNHSQKILFVGLTPCLEERSNPVSWDATTGYTSERVEAFDAALAKFCQDNQVPYVHLYKPFMAAQAKADLLPDGIHPNGEGHQLIMDLIKPKLEEMV